MKFNFKFNILKLLLILLVLFIIFMFIFMFNLLNKNNIYRGITINNIDIGGLNREEAIRYLENEFKENTDKKIIKLKYENDTYVIKGNYIDFEYNFYETVNDAYTLGREGNIFKRIGKIFSIYKNSFNLDLKILFNKDKLYLEMTKISNKINIEPNDAKIKYNNNSFIIVEEKLGKVVDKEKLELRIVEAIYNNNIVDIPIIIKKPKIYKDHLVKINKKISTFTTYFNENNTNKVENIKLAVKAIDGKVLLSDEIFSFNEATGNRDKESGYKEAKVLINGVYVPEYGGGVCQVATTLYNASIFSDLEIIERHHHSIPSNYIEYGRDATVAYNYLDLKLKNNTGIPIYIQGIANNYSVTINIYGNDTIERNIKIETKIIEVIEPKTEIIADNSLKPGEKVLVRNGRKGYRVETYKIRYDENKKADRELFSKDYYKPISTIIRMKR